MITRSIIKKLLSEAEEATIQGLFTISPYDAFFQNANYARVTGSDAVHVLMFDDERLVGYCLVQRKKRFFATIILGPIICKEDFFSEAVAKCVEALLDNGVKIIRYRPPNVSKSVFTKTIKKLQNHFKVFSLKTELNWSTLLLDITPSMKDLVKSFSGNHRRNIQKAQKANLIIEEITELGEIEVFSKGLKKMYSARGIASAANFEIESLKALFNYTNHLKNGIILKAMHEGIMIGGIVIVLHNNTAFNLMGFADPEYRKIPINYLLILRSIEIVKTFGLNVFDFGGIGRPGQADNQVLKINEFKEGFGGKKIDYPNTVIIAKNFLYKFLYTYYIQFKKIK